MPAQELSLRAARPAESNELAALINDAYGRTEAESGWTSEDEILTGPRVEPDGIEAILDDEDSRLFVAETDGETVGCVHLQRLEGGDVELGLLSVRPDKQADGLGRRILAGGEARAMDELDAERIILKVLTVREELLDWYERRGYERTGETKPFDPEEPQRSLVGDLAFAVLAKELA